MGLGGEMVVDSGLELLRYRVLATMASIDALDGENLTPLSDISLGKLRRDATRLHAVCRYNKGVRKSDPNIGPTDVRKVALHPVALSPEWERYAEFLLFHEFLHALGYAGHDRGFRELEAEWPDFEATQMGERFGRHLQERNAKWRWLCPECGWSTARSVKSRGRYLCRSCRVKLVDESVEMTVSAL
jgi:predicted SprT family Zn-dependent metalloprotease